MKNDLLKRNICNRLEHTAASFKDTSVLTMMPPDNVVFTVLTEATQITNFTIFKVKFMLDCLFQGNISQINIQIQTSLDNIIGVFT